MAKIKLQISYEIKPEKREEYLQLAERMKQHFSGDLKKNYTIYEQKGKKNFFVEEFICSSMEEFEKLEDETTETSEQLINQLETLLKDGKAKYLTLIEI